MTTSLPSTHHLLLVHLSFLIAISFTLATDLSSSTSHTSGGGGGEYGGGDGDEGGDCPSQCDLRSCPIVTGDDCAGTIVKDRCDCCPVCLPPEPAAEYEFYDEDVEDGMMPQTYGKGRARWVGECGIWRGGGEAM